MSAATGRATAPAPAASPSLAPGLEPGPALPTSTPPVRRRLDWGRIVMVPAAVIGGGLSVTRVAAVGGPGGPPYEIASAVLTSFFYALIVWAYLRRAPARRSTTSWGAWLAAPTATFLPFGLPFLGSGGADPAAHLVGGLLLVAGLAFSVWSVKHLDRCLSVVAQARDVVDTGPYARVRHPLYLGEIVAMLGAAITFGGVAPLLGWGVLVALQAYRAVREEEVLLAALPAYAGYRTRTARILPGVF